MSKFPDIMMEWDGIEDNAYLVVNGIYVEGLPENVQDVFDTLNTLRNRASLAEFKIEQVLDTMRNLERGLT